MSHRPFVQLALALVVLATCALPVAAQATDQPASLSPIALLPGVGMIAVGLGFVVYALRRRLGAGYLGIGMAAWLVTVAAKLVWATAMNSRIYAALSSVLSPTTTNLVASLYVGSLTGIFEVGLTYLALRLFTLWRVPWGKALAFGIGFGAIEALLLGISPLASALLYWSNPAAIPPEAVPNILAMNNPLLGIAPVWERFFTILIHIFTNVLIFLAIRRHAPRWFWLSFAYKTLLDTIAAYVQITGLITGVDDTSLGVTWLIEAIIGVLGLIAWYGIRFTHRAYPSD